MSVWVRGEPKPPGIQAKAKEASGKRGFGPRVGSREEEISQGGGPRRVQVGARSPGCRLPVGLGGQALQEREGGKEERRE